MNVQGLKNELNLKIQECNELHEELNKRPIAIKLKADLVSYNEHAKRTIKIEDKLKSNEIHYENVKVNDSIVRVRVIETNWDCIFYGITCETLIGDKIEANKLIEFQSCDCTNNDINRIHENI